MVGGSIMAKEQPKTIFAAWVSLASNIGLTIIKVFVGTVFQSTALIADGVHNGGDVIASIATLSSMRVSNLPADKEHPYGHGKAEDIATGIIAIILSIAALFLIYESVRSLLLPPEKASLITLIAAFISLLWKFILYRYTIKIGKASNRKSLIATAYDHLSDVYASIAAVIGIAFGVLGDHYAIPFAVYGDPLAGIIVSILVLKVAIQMGSEAMNVLMESNIPSEKRESFIEVISSVPEVKRIDRLRARENGHYILVDLRISVPADLTIREGHDITGYIRDEIMKANKDVEEVLIHLNPWYPEQKKHS